MCRTNSRSPRSSSSAQRLTLEIARCPHDEPLELHTAQPVADRRLEDTEDLADPRLPTPDAIARVRRRGEPRDQRAVEIEERADLRSRRARGDLRDPTRRLRRASPETTVLKDNQPDTVINRRVVVSREESAISTERRTILLRIFIVLSLLACARVIPDLRRSAVAARPDRVGRRAGSSHRPRT